jgi:hypothetical protein
MATFIPGKVTPRKRRAALQAALYRARTKSHGDIALVDDPTSLAWGSITFPINPSSGDTITLGGTVVTFGTDVTIGAGLSITLASLLVFLNASANANIIKCTYSVGSASLSVREKLPNTTTFTLAASAGTVSHATLQLVKIDKRAAL